MASRALFAALELDLFTRLSGTGKAVESLSRETQVSANVAKRYVADAGLQERITHLPGNALGTDWPRDHEVILMSYLWSAVRGTEIEALSKRAYDALPPGGMVLIHDFMVDNELKGPPTAAFHLLILALDNPEMVSLTPSFVAKRMSDVGFQNVTGDTLIPGITSLVIGYKP